VRFAKICAKNQALKKIISFFFNLMKRKIPLLRPILNASEPEGSTCTAVGIPNSNSTTVELSRTELGTLPPLVLGGIIENQNSDFVMT
jgi:hypothetical protein